MELRSIFTKEKTIPAPAGVGIVCELLLLGKAMNLNA
tara:strand:- start:1043 stop:1153 length:111 start_codon:yes stop_codon:yes gene_type:complete